MFCVLEFITSEQSLAFDEAGIANAVLHTKRVTHRARDGLYFLCVLIGEGDQHDEEAYEQAHEIGEGDEPAVTATVSFFAPRHDYSSLSRFVTAQAAPK